MGVTITKRYEWAMAHRLPNHNGKCRRLHGHTYAVDVDITGVLQKSGPQEGMVVDFSAVKGALEQTIGQWDHCCMLCVDDPVYPAMIGVPGVFTVPFVPTAENIALEILRLLSEWGLNVTRVTVHETLDSSADVCP